MSAYQHITCIEYDDGYLNIKRDREREMLLVSCVRGLFISVLGIKVFLVPLHLHLRGSVQIQKTLQPFIMNHNILSQTQAGGDQRGDCNNICDQLQSIWYLFMLRITIILWPWSSMINLSIQMFKVTIYQKCCHLSAVTLTSPLQHVSHSQGIIELCSEEC